MRQLFTRAEIAHLAETRSVLPWAWSRAMQLATITATKWTVGPDAEAIEWHDLLQEAWAMAWKALLTFDPRRGCRLDPWIISNCRGAIQDALRRADPLTRGERAKLKERTEGSEVLPFRQILSFEDVAWGGDGEQKPLPFYGSLIYEDPALAAVPDRIDAERLARRAIHALPTRRLRAVAWLYGAKGLTQKEVARRLGITETYVQEIWAQARPKMKAAIQAEGG